MVKDKQEDTAKDGTKDIVKVATYNVLKVAENPLFNVILKPQERYKYQMNVLFPSLDVDILCLNEVQHDYHGELMQNKDLKERFPYKTEKEDTPNKNQIHNMILSKYPFRVYKQCINPATIIALVNLPCPLILVSTHLESQEGNYCVRA